MPAFLRIGVRSVLWCAIAILAARASSASPVLSGTVTQEGALYVYSYVLDNTAGTGPIGELSVLINSLSADERATPLSHTEPSGWTFGTAVSGGIANPPYLEIGEFWQWNAPISELGLPVGQTLSGFSFTTQVAPTSSTANNYFLYCRGSCGGPFPDVIEYGHIVAPDFLLPPLPPQGVPEPAFFWPILAGAIVGGFVKRRA